MKLLTIDTGGKGHAGVLSKSGEVMDLVRAKSALPNMQLLPETVRGILEGGEQALALVRQCIEAVEAMSAEAKGRHRLSGMLKKVEDTVFLAPIPDPLLVLSAAANYGKHVNEFTAVPMPKHPTAFIKTSNSISAHNKPILIPPQCPDRIDFEGELCFVFGRTCYNVSEEDAMNYVAGYLVANDVSARNWTPEVFAAEERFASIRAWERNVMGKNLPGFTPCGPFLTTADEVPDPHNLSIRTTLNGVVMQDGSTSELLYNIPQLISYFSKWYCFQPGDIFTTGSPAGVGVGRKPPVFMKEGDLIEVEIAGLGKLSNKLEHPKAP
jgi:acylpyruvate hydrolase